MTDAAADSADPHPLAAACLDALRARGETVATAESLTAGLVCATLATVPGASDCLRGGLAAYATDVKAGVLGVDQAVIDRYGVVSAECAEAMARGGCRLLGADWAAATTGVAGPAQQDGVRVGTVYVSVAGPAGQTSVESLIVPGSREQVRRGAVEAALSLLLRVVAAESTGHGQRAESPI